MVGLRLAMIHLHKVAAIVLSAALMLRHAFGWESEAAAVESAVDRALAAGLRTRDLGGDATTADATEAVLSHLS